MDSRTEGLPCASFAAAAERIGVFAEPELERRTLGPSSSFVVIASDGVFEFLSSQSVVDMVSVRHVKLVGAVLQGCAITASSPVHCTCVVSLSSMAGVLD